MAHEGSSLHPLDWAVLLGYLIVLIVTGVVFSRRRQHDTREYFLAGRKMPVWAVAASIIATAISAATFIGLPEQSYTGDTTFLSASIGQVIAAIIIATVFIPAFYRHNVSTVYQLLEYRFGEPTKLTASGMFMIGRVFADGARVYIASIAVAMIVFGEPPPGEQIAYARLFLGIVCLIILGVTYTLTGGIASVIWTNTVQALVFLIAILAVLILLWARTPLDLEGIRHSLSIPQGGGASKLTVINLGIRPGQPFWGFDFSQGYTLITAVLCFSLFNMAAFGTDHELAQRLLTCSTPYKAGWSLLTAIFIGVPFTCLFLAIGLMLYVYDQQTGMTPGVPASLTSPHVQSVFLRFIMHQMPSGLVGLTLAGLFAAALSSINSSLNAMSATFVTDFYRPWKRGRSELHYLAVGRAGVIFWGIIQMVFAVICVFWQRHSGQTLIDFALSVMTFAYSGLLAVFLTAILTKRGNNISAIFAMIAGFIFVFILQPTTWQVFWDYVNRSFIRIGIDTPPGDFHLEHPER
jgi:SSS family transporter